MLDVPYALLMSLSTALGSPLLAVVLCTLAVRTVLLPLSLRAYRAGKARARLAPRLAELRERHPNDPQALAVESMSLMRAEGTGPLAGLMPALLQAPVFFILYRLCTASTVGGSPNALLGDPLLGARFDPALPVWWLLLVGLVAIAWWTARLLPADAPKLLRVLPYGTVVAAVIVPVAAALYLLTSSLWTALERTLLR